MSVILHSLPSFPLFLFFVLDKRVQSGTKTGLFLSPKILGSHLFYIECVGMRNRARVILATLLFLCCSLVLVLYIFFDVVFQSVWGTNEWKW